MTARELSEYVIGQAVEQLDALDGATTALRDGAVDSAGNHLRRVEDNILHLDLPVPVSLAFPLTATVIVVPKTDFVRTKGDVKEAEQESPTVVAVAQLLLGEPGPMEVRL